MSSKNSAGIFPKEVTRDQAKDTGMALLLIIFLYLYFAKGIDLILYPGIVLLLNMTVPDVFKLPAKFWFGLSHLLGTVMTKVLLTLIFAVIVVPIGLIRRLLGADAMRIKPWKKGTDSVFVNRDHTFASSDLETPF